MRPEQLTPASRIRRPPGSRGRGRGAAVFDGEGEDEMLIPLHGGGS